MLNKLRKLFSTPEDLADRNYYSIIERRVDFVEEIIPKNGIGVELGVFRGHFSPTLLNVSRAKELHLIDPWFTLGPAWEWAEGNQSTVDGLINILQKLKENIERRQVKVHIGDDLKLLKSFPDNYFDWAYIDSTHEYQHTVSELELLRAKVKDNGVIAGDDWRVDPNDQHHGVYRAVQEFTASGEYQVIYSDSTNLQWAIRKVDGD